MNKNLFKTRKVLCLALAFVTVLSLSISATGGPSGDPYSTEPDTEDIYNTGSDTTLLTGWVWGAADAAADTEEGILSLPDVSSNDPVTFEEAAAMLPQSVMASVDGVEETLALTWSCEDFPQSAWYGEYLFTAALPEGYALGEGAAALRFIVRVGAGEIIFDEVEFGFSQADDGYYEIRTIEDYNSFMIYVSAKPVNADKPYDSAVNVRLMNDLTIPSSYSTYPIGTKSFPYTGTFDGGGHTLTINRYYTENPLVDKTYEGIFGCVGQGGSINNLNVVITGQTYHWNYKGLDQYTNCTYEGLLCGYLDGGSISNCHITLENNYNSMATESFGGLVGYAKNSIIEECSVDLRGHDVTSLAKKLGGIVGEVIAASNCRISNCSAEADLDRNMIVSANAVYTGGIAGHIHFPDATTSNNGSFSFYGCSFAGSLLNESSLNAGIVAFYELGPFATGFSYAGGATPGIYDLSAYIGSITNDGYSIAGKFPAEDYPFYNQSSLISDDPYTLLRSAFDQGKIHTNCTAVPTSPVMGSTSISLSSVQIRTEAQYRSGHVTYDINYGSDYSWHAKLLQTIGTDICPTRRPDALKVYKGCRDGYYTNHDTVDEKYLHNFVNGICVNSDSTDGYCGMYEPTASGSVGYVTIANLGQLLWVNEHLRGVAGTSGNCVGYETWVDASDRFVLTADIVFNDTNVVSNGSLIADPSTLRVWELDGMPTFTGTFDGQGHSISGLYNNSLESRVGLFSTLSGTVRNLTLADTFFQGTANSGYVGGIAAYCSGGTVTNCTVTDSGLKSVTSADNGIVGGIVGAAENATISHCTVTSGCTFGTRADCRSSGGIVGQSGPNSSGSVRLEFCRNEGALIQGDSYAGGIVGIVQSNTDLYACYNIGNQNVYPSELWPSSSNVHLHMGGIVGGWTNGGGTLTSCYARYTPPMVNPSDPTSYYNYAYKALLIGYLSGGSVTLDRCVTSHTTASNGGGTIGEGSTNLLTINDNCKANASLTSGEATWVLNGGVTDGSQPYYQDIDNDQPIDNHPVFSDHGKTVYYGYLNCLATSKIYSNSPISEILPDHNFQNGFCVSELDGVVCGKYQSVTEIHQDYNFSGSWSRFYVIRNAGQLYWMSEHITGKAATSGSMCAEYNQNVSRTTNFMLGSDIVINENLADFVGDPRQWIYNNSDSAAFAGEFNGNGKSITGLCIDSPTIANPALFGKASGATVRDLTIAGSRINAPSMSNAAFIVGDATGCTLTGITIADDCSVAGGQFTGGIVGGLNDSGSITDCTNGGTVTGGQYTGGIVGNSDVAVTGCTNGGSVTGSREVGGIVGYTSADITDCTNAGAVSANQFTGGIVGESYGSVSGCTNTATVQTSEHLVGGIVGCNRVGAVENCRNTGDISGEFRAGGIVGVNGNTEDFASVTNCINEGDITTSSYGAGGIVGDNDAAGSITGCRNTGTVTAGGSRAGGIAGANRGGGGWTDYFEPITRCYNEGNVSGDEHVGGIAGDNCSPIIDCYNTGTVSGGAAYRTGGIAGSVGEGEGGSIENCHNVGTVSAGGGIAGSVSSIGTLTNCYSLTAPIHTNNGTATNVEQRPSEQFESGEITYLLNGGVTNGSQVWYQDVDNEETGATLDAYPVFEADGATVYGGASCDGTSQIFSNSPISGIGGAHIFDEHGFCSNYNALVGKRCNAYEPVTEVTAENYESLGLPSSEIGSYAIGNAGQLWYYACFVNGHSPYGNTSDEKLPKTSEAQASRAVLTADIDMSKAPAGVKWIPIGFAGYQSDSFTGSFDGRGHTISNLTHSTDFTDDDANTYERHFGIIGSFRGSEIKNLTVKNFDVTTSMPYAGLICGEISGGDIINCHAVDSSIESTATNSMPSVGGILGMRNITTCHEYMEVYVERCSSNAQVTGTMYAGGIVGYSYFYCDWDIIPVPKFIIKDCANHGAIVGGENDYGSVASGGIIGDFAYSDLGESAMTVIENCYNTGTLQGSLPSGTAAFCAFGNARFENCYYLATTGADGGAGTILAKDAAQFAGGEVAWLLNGGVTDGTQAWYQDLDNGKTPEAYPDLFPTATPTNTVYTGYKSCFGAGYTNDPDAGDTPVHNFENGFCVNTNGYDTCGKYQSATLVTAENRGTLGLDAAYDGYYAIENAGQLYWMNEHLIGKENLFESSIKSAEWEWTGTTEVDENYDTFVHANFVLVDDITINKGLSESTEDARPWTFHEDNRNYRFWFSGTFDGKGHSITGFYVGEEEDNGYAGIFPQTKGATIKDFTVKESIINTPDCTAAMVVVAALDTTIERITIDEKCSITSEQYPGGIVGMIGSMEGTASIIDCSNAGDVASEGVASGIVGMVQTMGGTTSIIGCSNTGCITVATPPGSAMSQLAAGGIVGGVVSAGGTTSITGCSNTGDVSAIASPDTNPDMVTVGGIVGVQLVQEGTASVTDCSNTGSVIASGNNAMAGGIAGMDQLSEIARCANTGAVTSSSMAGGVAGMAASASITDCYNMGDVSGDAFAGGVGGMCQETAVANCYNIGGITGPEGAFDQIVAPGSTGTVTNCYYLAGIGGAGRADTVLAKDADQFASGEVAWLLNEEKPASGSDDVSALAWRQDIDNGNEPYDPYPLFDGGVVYRGYTSCQDGAAMRYSNSPLSALPAHNFVNGFCTNEIGEGVFCGMYEHAVPLTAETREELGLAESYDGYYAITNAGQLYWMSEHIIGKANAVGHKSSVYDASATASSNFVLTGNIVINENLSNFVGDPRQWVYGSSDSDTPFSGIFDGNGKSITGLYINAAADAPYHGLFGRLDGGTLENLTLRECSINVSNGTYVGAVVGYAVGASSITGITVAADCSVTNENTSGYTGGIAGIIAGVSESERTTITRSYNAGTVSGAFYTAGITGLCGNHSTIENCYNTGSTSAIGMIAGAAGIAGDLYSAGAIRYCYSTGAAHSEGEIFSYMGGIIATNAEGIVSYCYSLIKTSEKGMIDTCEIKTPEQFASGEVAWLLNKKQPTGTNIDGLDLIWRQDVDNGQQLDPSPNFTDAVVYPMYDCVGGSTPTGYTNDPDKAGASHDFVNGFCRYCDKYQSAMPVTNENCTALGLGGGYVGYYAIENAGQLYWMSEHVIGEANGGKSAEYNANVTASSRFVLVANVTINEGLSAENTAGMRTWIYSDGDAATAFTGTFDGNGKSITGLYIHSEDATVRHGMFGYASGASIHDLTMSACVVNVPNGERVGMLVGEMVSSSAIEHITIDGDCSVRGGVHTGGVVGRNEGSYVRYASNAGDVTGTRYVGGISGYNYNCYDAPNGNCSNSGDILAIKAGDSTGGDAGGIVGMNVDSVLTKCYNTGSISVETGNLGGICSVQSGSYSLADCYNTGSVTGATGGGIAAILESGAEVKNCYSTGELSFMGFGIVCVIPDGCTVTNCYSIDPPLRSTSSGTITDVEQKTAEEFASGEIAWLLNEKRPADANGEVAELIWRQDIDNGERPYDPSPNFTDDFVYPVESCMGGEDPASYTNDPANAAAPTHSFSAHGFCENTNGVETCHAYEPATLGAGMYVECEIENLGQLFWFAAHVNNAAPTVDGNVDALTVNGSVGNSARATLMADLDFANVPDGITWVPIGAFANYDNAVASRPYLGTFDGGRHIVSDLSVSIGREAGFFGRVGNADKTAVIQNLGVVGTVHSTNDRAGVLAGELYRATVTNCFAAGTATTDGAGCQTGVFAGEAAEAAVSNCHGYDAANKLTFLGEGGTAPASITNCYYLAASGSTAGQSASTILPKTAEQFANGEVAWLLNNKRPTSEDDNIDILSLVWKQTLDADLYPIFTGNPPIFDDGGGGGGGDVDYVQVEVSWTNMTFNYGHVWIPEEHAYSSTWTPIEDGGGALTIRNIGNALKVNVIIEKLAIASGVDIYRGYRGPNTWMKNDNAASVVRPDGEGNVALASGDRIKSSLSIFGDPADPLGEEASQIASIIISLISD